MNITVKIWVIFSSRWLVGLRNEHADNITVVSHANVDRECVSLKQKSIGVLGKISG